MALIKCPECGGQVSDKATVCIHCGYPLPKEITAAIPEQKKEEPPAIQETTEDSPKAKLPITREHKILNLKTLLVLILGSLYVICILLNQLMNLGLYTPWLYTISSTLCSILPAAAMIFITLKKKIPALILSILALAIWSIQEIVLTVLYPISFTSPVTILLVLYYALAPILLLVYILAGSHHRNSLIWSILFLAIAAYEVIDLLLRSSGTFIVTNGIYMLLYLSFYFIGYSPDKWYRKKQSQTPPGREL